MPMEVLGSFPTLLELASAGADAGADASYQSGLQIQLIGEPDRRAPVPLPLLEPGHIVLLSVRIWGSYPNYHWFIVARDAASRDLLLALHRGNLELFDGDVFGESKALGFGFSLSEICQRFEPKYECTSKGAHLTLLAIDVNSGEDAESIRISAGETRTINIGGREHGVWLSGAMRIKIEDYVGCTDFVPDDALNLAVW
jgi:hypothetical protein